MQAAVYAVGMNPKVNPDDVEPALACVNRCVKDRRHRTTIKQALGLKPYEGMGKTSESAKKERDKLNANLP